MIEKHRKTVSTITDVDLDHLYDELDEANKTIAELGEAYQVLKDRQRAYMREVGDLFVRVDALERAAKAFEIETAKTWAALETAHREGLIDVPPEGVPEGTPSNGQRLSSPVLM